MAGDSRLRSVFIIAAVIVAGGADGADQTKASPTEADLQSSGANCQLADLFLHSPPDGDGNAQPIDTFKAANKPNAYIAQMDYNMEGFDIEARAVPEDRCQLDQMVQTTTMVDPGSSVAVQLIVRDRTLPKSSDNSKLYRVQVSRLFGTETSLRALKVDHGILIPRFDSANLNYTSYLDVSQDIVKIIFERMDNGQVVGLASSLEEPLGTEGRLLQAQGDPLGPPIGEVQYLPSSLTSTIDVGRQRLINVVVQSADRSAVGQYIFKVQRPFCPEERRFFDGMAKKCTDICNEGSFGNHATGRCSMCLTRHCADCDAQNRCSSCAEGFGLQAGKCVAGGGNAGGGGLRALTKLTTQVQGYTQRHVLLFVGASVASTAALCACLFTIFLGGQGGRCNARRVARGRGRDIIDSDEELSVRSSESIAYS